MVLNDRAGNHAYRPLVLAVDTVDHIPQMAQEPIKYFSLLLHQLIPDCTKKA